MKIMCKKEERKTSAIEKLDEHQYFLLVLFPLCVCSGCVSVYACVMWQICIFTSQRQNHHLFRQFHNFAGHLPDK